MKTKHLDPDYRRDPPLHTAYCCRCQKPLKKPRLTVRVRLVDACEFVIHPETPPVVGEYTRNIGDDCAEALGLEWTSPA